MEGIIKGLAFLLSKTVYIKLCRVPSPLDEHFSKMQLCVHYFIIYFYFLTIIFLSKYDILTHLSDQENLILIW